MNTIRRPLRGIALIGLIAALGACNDDPLFEIPCDPPTADAGVDQTVFETVPGEGADVTLDGSASVPAEGDAIATWKWTLEDGTELTGPSLGNGIITVNLPVGVHTITLETTTVSGCTDTDTVIITVEESVGAPVITMTAPAGGTTVLPGDVVTISWTATDDVAVTSVDLLWTIDGVAETVIATDLPGDQVTYDWTTPADEVLYGVHIKGVAHDADGQTGEDMTDGMLAVIQFSERGYVTSAGCVDCHADDYSEVFDFSGHPYKLNKVVDGVAPTYPNSVVPNPPDGVTWNDVSYVIGGYGWKARFIGTEAFNQGYIITPATGANQWNLLPETWTDYHPGEVKPYDCGSCHTTGWQSLDENGGVHQDGLTGFEGTFEEQGVTCEQCHGVGVDHVATQSSDDITIDTSPELCGSCHNRGLDPIDLIPASGGFIKHHEQYNEWANSGGHFNGGADCYACHDSHLGTLYDNGGFITTCETCHADKVDTNNHVVAVDCVTCHMPKASKSAVPATDNTIYEGDIQTHIFKINPAAVGMDEFFTADGSAVVDDPIGVTLDFVCYQCHDDLAGEGGGMSEQSLADLSARATGIHTP